MFRLPLLAVTAILWAGIGFAAPPPSDTPAVKPSAPQSSAPQSSAAQSSAAQSSAALQSGSGGHYVDTVLTSDAEMQRIADDRVATYHDSVGLIIGVIEPTGRRLIARGPAQIGNDDPVNGDTIFQIGSVTKLFTAALLADMARRGEVALTDPVKKYLPAGTAIPQRGGHEITLGDLATHMSGLPKALANVLVTDFNNPNADMSEAQLFQSLQRYELTRDPGASYEFSDAGYDLLGIALADRGQTDFETLLRSRILAPLHMDNTRFVSSLTEKDRMAATYDEHLHPIPRPPTPSLPAADGMRSTANDLLDFLAANLGLTNSPVNSALADMLKTQQPTPFKELKSALGWNVATLHGFQTVWISGQTAGSRAFIAFSPLLHAGVVVLSNSANAIDDIGIHILDPQRPLRKLHREVPVSSSLFDNYTGRYQVDENFSLEVTRDAGRLYIQGTGQPRAELFAEADDKFFLRVVSGEVTFKTDSGGRARSLELAQDGKTALAILVHY